MITVGFTLIGRGAWSGGETYLRNMLGVISDELGGEVRAKLFLTPAQRDKLGGSLDRFLAEPPIVDDRVAGAGSGADAIRAYLTGSARGLAQVAEASGIDLLFQSAQYMGERFPVALLSWIPDFQHRHLPQMFSRRAWLQREAGFRLQTGSRSAIMLSSCDARADCERFYPASRGKIAVVRFAIDLDPAAVYARVATLRGAHGLPERFFYLPNQFWSHKNHAAVVAALLRLKADGRLAGIPPIILTGRTDNPRDPHLYERLMTQVSDNGLDAHFRHLGLVPYEDVFALNAACERLINPSFFEGWSTPVEEAKALGTPMLLSSLSVHREQAPDAAFFDPHDPAALAELLSEASRSPPAPRAPVEELRLRQGERRRAYADALLAAFNLAIARAPTRHQHTRT